MLFDNFNLNPKILKAISKAGYTQPTQIQSQSIPIILDGNDIRASAQTGTGKTAAFLIPSLNHLLTPAPSDKKGPRVLILAPTRELALQIHTQAEKYSKFIKTKSICILGGIPFPQQMRKLSSPYEILIATPGRLIDFIQRGKIDLSRLEILILDEADRMLDMGFVKPVETIVSMTPPVKQTLFFSATIDKNVLKLSEKILNNPKEIKVQTDYSHQNYIKQKIHFVNDMNHKNQLLNHILTQNDVEHTIIFTSTKRHADRLVTELRDQDHLAVVLHGNLNQRQRLRSIDQLQKGKARILVATDVAARGLDIKSISHVINYDFPQNVEDYIHRIGRTGRAGAAGTALSFATKRENYLIKKIETFTSQKIAVEVIAGIEPKTKPSPIKKRKDNKPTDKHKNSKRFKTKTSKKSNKPTDKHKNSKSFKTKTSKKKKLRAKSLANTKRRHHTD